MKEEDLQRIVLDPDCPSNLIYLLQQEIYQETVAPGWLEQMLEAADED